MFAKHHPWQPFIHNIHYTNEYDFMNVVDFKLLTLCSQLTVVTQEFLLMEGDLEIDSYIEIVLPLNVKMVTTSPVVLKEE